MVIILLFRLLFPHVWRGDPIHLEESPLLFLPERGSILGRPLEVGAAALIGGFDSLLSRARVELVVGKDDLLGRGPLFGGAEPLGRDKDQRLTRIQKLR